MIRLVVVDDNEPTRKAAIKELATDGVIQIVGEAETSDEALKMGQQLLPDLVLLDLHLPGLMSTPDLIKRLVALRNVKVIVYASQSKAAEIQDLFATGASAYVLKSDPVMLIRMTALMVARGGKAILSPTLPYYINKLSATERNILHEITKRGGPAKAAERMGISEADLNHIMEQLAQKLEQEDGDKLAKWAKKQGF